MTIAQHLSLSEMLCEELQQSDTSPKKSIQAVNKSHGKYIRKLSDTGKTHREPDAELDVETA